MKLIKRIDGTRRGIFECPTCGAHKELSLYRGTHKSVCSLKCRHNQQNVTHNSSRTKLYKVWKTMKTRVKKKPTYVEKGIKVCDEWKNSFDNFKNWAEESGYIEKEGGINRDTLTIDRIDNDGDYEPSNCRWITMSENSSKDNYNRKSVIQMTLDGKFIKEWDTMADATRELGIDSSGIAKVCKGLRNKAGGFKWSYKD